MIYIYDMIYIYIYISYIHIYVFYVKDYLCHMSQHQLQPNEPIHGVASGDPIL